MAEFEKQESEYISAKEIQNVPDLTIEILDEVKNVATDFGAKPQGTVKVSNGTESHEKKMNFNQKTVNALIDETKSTDSKKWIGVKFVPKIETVKGNLAIFPDKFLKQETMA